ncbi:MAG TPA: hypothetical protein VE569_10195, partial [Acidimicrobiia bacterium]|nr:hypothetical protein [Acidimicrobiia bacterium]
MTHPVDTARPPPRSGLRGLAAAVGAGLLAIIVFGYASQPREVAAPPTTQAVVAEPEPVVTTIPQASTTTTIDQIIDGPLLEFLPEATGSVMTAVAGTSDSHLLTLPSGATATRTELPVGTGPVLFFDAADRQMAFLGSSLRLSGLTLYVGGLQGWVPLTGRVTSFAWHSTWPGRLAWVETGEGLCVADIDTDGSTVAAPRCLPRVSGRLTGFDDHGFLVVTD